MNSIQKFISIIAGILVYTAPLAETDFIIIPIPIKNECKPDPITEPIVIPTGCVRKDIVQTSWSTYYLNDLQWRVMRENGSVLRIETFDITGCMKVINEKFICSVNWQVPPGIWYWQWLFKQIPQHDPVCVFGGYKLVQ